jgi:hypothetical protein
MKGKGGRSLAHSVNRPAAIGLCFGTYDKSTKNLGVPGKKKITLFLWEEVLTTLELLVYQYSLLKWRASTALASSRAEVKKLD